MSRVLLTDPGNVVNFERGETHVLVEHDGSWFWVPERFVERAEPTEPPGKLTVVAVNRGEPGAGVVTLDGAPVELLRWDSPEAKRAADDWAAGKVEPEHEAAFVAGRRCGKLPAMPGPQPNRRARRAAKRGGR